VKGGWTAGAGVEGAWRRLERQARVSLHRPWQDRAHVRHHRPGGDATVRLAARPTRRARRRELSVGRLIVRSTCDRPAGARLAEGLCRLDSRRTRLCVKGGGDCTIDTSRRGPAASARTVRPSILAAARLSDSILFSGAPPAGRRARWPLMNILNLETENPLRQDVWSGPGRSYCNFVVC